MSKLALATHRNVMLYVSGRLLNDLLPKEPEVVSREDRRWSSALAKKGRLETRRNTLAQDIPKRLCRLA